MKKALFAMGCFWGPEALFRKQKGVTDVTVGYSGGHVDHPSYKKVCGGNTGHAETVEIHFDPEQVSYEDLLRVFWNNHNPTTPNRQGPDVGSQYRSAVFYLDEEQKQQAERLKQEFQEGEKFDGEIVTEITEAGEFWPAEDYHQRYLEKRGVTH